jgi:2-polyprenyl-3-methyl-5-hydroxy-6-metoxy-1,4-benzoquinol methylase
MIPLRTFVGAPRKHSSGNVRCRPAAAREVPPRNLNHAAASIPEPSPHAAGDRNRPKLLAWLPEAALVWCGSVSAEDPKEIVRRGYDALSEHYDEQYGGDTKYGAWLEELRGRVPAGSAVLDLGCGSGIPVARDLAASGYRVTGVDISEVQISRASQMVPDAEFIQADMTSVAFSPGSFAAVVSFFALIHLPLEDQFPLLARIASWLVPGGVLVATTGYWAWTGTDDNWLDGGVPMWWSHADVAAYRSWISRAGFLIEREEFVPEGEGGHALFWARRMQDVGAPAC